MELRQFIPDRFQNEHNEAIQGINIFISLGMVTVCKYIAEASRIKK